MADTCFIDSPFMMSSQAERLKREALVRESGELIKETSAQRKRRKKSQREVVLSGLERKIASIISTALPDLAEQARKLKCLHETPLCSSDNNQTAREASQIAGCGHLFPDLCCAFDEDRLTQSHISSDVYTCSGGRDGGRGGGGKKTDPNRSSDVILLNEENDLSLQGWAIIGRHVCNVDDAVKVIQVDSHRFLIPPRSSFVTSSFHHFVCKGYKQIQVKTGYDLIVLDPPWNNKSVKRKKSYQTVDETDLKDIPVGELAANRGLICVWVTNNERLKDFVTDELFPHWSVDFLAEWIWLKVTRTGEPVCDIQSPQKKPYEQLIIGRLVRHPKWLAAGPCGEGGVAVSDVGQDKSSDPRLCLEDTADQNLPEIPPDFLLASVPCSLHSKKPSLAGIFSKYLPTSPCCLELFARNLMPGWVSWGFEPLLHQHVDYFEQIH